MVGVGAGGRGCVYAPAYFSVWRVLTCCKHLPRADASEPQGGGTTEIEENLFELLIPYKERETDSVCHPKIGFCGPERTCATLVQTRQTSRCSFFEKVKFLFMLYCDHDLYTMSVLLVQWLLLMMKNKVCFVVGTPKPTILLALNINY